ncbi:MAG: glycosyltransferase family 2 protein [Parvularculaceae bacterium]
MNPTCAIAASIIVPHFDQCELLARCLESLEAQTWPRANYEIIVADNDTPGGVAEIAALFPDVIFLTEKTRGAAAARNAAMARARGDVFAFTDADCIAAPDWLACGIDALNKTEMAGGAVNVTVRNELAMSPEEAFERVFAFRQRRYIEQKNFAVTANLFVCADVARRIGVFVNGVSEDVDWCRRGRALGFHLAFNDKSIVSHPARRNWTELSRKWDRMVAERWSGFGGRSPFRQWAWAGLAVATALSVAPHMVRIFASAELSAWRDRIAATGVLARIRWRRAGRMLSLLRAG